ncbi:MAG: hypothetical protein DRI80_19785 [Chloroflexota bacterium]|nr:MAG: hypothetical protein DRI80_19785 [Chloroflexota bacterium]
MKAEELAKRYGDQAEVVLSNVVTVAESYVDAALVVDVDMDSVERAVLDAAEKYSGCVGCRYSRASRNAEEYARRRGSLPITMRRCILGLRQDGCSAFEPIIPGR